MEPHGRAFDDFTATRTNVFDNVLNAAKAIKPMEYGGRRLELTDVDYDPADVDDESDKFSYGAQSKAIREKQTMGRRLRGTFLMTDLATGEQQQEQRLLAVVPRVNEDGTMLYRGSRYAFVNQQRLKPASYGRVKKNQELEVFNAVKQGTGPTHRYVFDPDRSVFFFSLGNSRIPLAGVLKTLGATDDDLKAAWGDEIAAKNIKADNGKNLQKVFEHLGSREAIKTALSDEDKRNAIRETFAKMEVDPWVLKRNLGIESDRLTPEVILASTRKILDMGRGDQEGDDRDSLQNQKIHSVEDFLAERISMDSGREQQNSFRKALSMNKLSAVGHKLLQKQLEDSVFGSGLAILPENPNPLSAWSTTSRITKLGEGGVGSTDAIPKESRDYNASHAGYFDPSVTVESSRIGVDLNVGSRTIKGKDGRIYTPLINARTGQTEYVAAEDMADKVLAPDKETDIPGHYSAIRNGSEDYYSKDEIDYFLPDKETAFAGISNLVPLKMMQPHNRTAMGQRFLSQAVPLVNREAPLVRSAVPGSNSGLSFESLYRDRVGVVATKVGGVVKDVKPDRIVIQSQGPDGKPVLKTHWLHEHTSLGAKTAMMNKPVVQVGQEVAPDDVLATSNFSDDKGDIAMGINAKMALMPWGDNYEDAYTISESFARRTASHQSYDHRREFNPDSLIQKTKFISALPSAYNKEQLEKLDDHGVVQVGQVLKNGDPVMLSAVRKAVNLAKPLTRSGHRAYQDQSQVWDHENDGTVTAVHRDARGNVHVSVDTNSPTIDADKFSELYGTKGVVKVIPDDQMIHDENGEPFDVVSSDLGLISRKNSSRAVAMWLGKVAQKTGSPIFVDEDDNSEEIMDKAYRLMKEHGVTPTETVVDPKTGRKIPGVATGPQFMMKLTHQAESKANARALGAYDANGQPAKGSDDGMQAKRVSNQELGALMAHGAMSYLQEIGTVKGSKNEEWAARFMAGQDLPAVEVPMAYNKFLSYVKGMGVNPVRTGSVTRLWLMNNGDIDQLSGGRQVRAADTVNLAKDLKPISGGLFDPAIFGDDGKKFAMYQLATPIPHPSMEKPLLKVMNITGKQFRGVLSGKEELGEYGTGVQAISKFLENLDIGKEKAKAIHKIRTGARTAKDAAIQQYRYLSAIEKHGLKPNELIIDKVPILPPIYRPISKLAGKDTPLIDGLNHLYQQMIYADQNQREIGKYADDDSEERLATYDAVQAAMGLQEPADKELRQKNVKGIMKKLVGPNPKNSFLQGKLLSHTVDSVGRGVALPNAQLKLNEIGIPEEQAWKIFEMPMMRQLTRRGISVTEAKDAIEQRKPVARDALEREMAYRPVTSSRAPVLHKFGIMGFMPKLVEGYSLQFNPLVHPAYNLDHDGDARQCTVVIAVKTIADFGNETKKALAEEASTDMVRSALLNLTIQEIQDKTVASITRANLPVLQGYSIVSIDLADFPRLTRTNVSRGRCGDIHWYSVPEDVKVLAVNRETGKAEWASVSRWTEHHGCEVEIVTLASGHQIYTDDDPRGLLGVDPTTSLRIETFTPTVAFKRGVLVPRARKFKGVEAAVENILLPRSLNNASHATAYQLVEQVNLDKDLGWFVGAHVADGWSEIQDGVPRATCFAKSNSEVRLKWEQQVSRFVTTPPHFGLRVRDKSDAEAHSAFGGTKASIFSCTALAYILHDEFGHGAVNKHLPTWTMLGSDEFRRGVILGLVDTDMTIAYNQAKAKRNPQLQCWYNTVSLRLAREVALLAMSVGIGAKVRWSKQTIADNSAWEVQLKSGDLQDFYKQYGHAAIDKERADLIINAVIDRESSAYQRDSRVPITLKLAAEMRRKLGVPKDRSKAGADHRSLYAALTSAVKCGYLSQSVARLTASLVTDDFIASQPDGLDFIKWRDDDTITWEYIDELEKTGKVEIGYDLTVPGYENWMESNGVFGPNTMNFHAVITDDAVKEVKEKMLPTSMLFSPADFESPMFVPRQDHGLGLYLASTSKEDRRPVSFVTMKDAFEAFQRGEININTPTRILKK